jgi:histidyl-tRNA synthetase
VRLQVNSRKLIEGYYLGAGVASEQVADVMRVVDKIDKVSADTVVAMLTDEVGLSTEQARTCVALTDVTADGDELAGKVKALGVQHPLLDEGVDELARVLTGAARLRSDRFSVVADLRIARGLDYYTGTVYETRMQGFEHVGSICSGGRYDALASDGRTTYPGVGISLGVTRAVGPLLGRGLLTASRSTPTCVLVALPDEESRASLEVVATALRSRGIATEVSPSAAKYGKQIRYAERRGIPYVWFPQDEGSHQVRDIRSGDQVDADPQAWVPPEADLRPSVSGSADL